jgi:hypothetical protein
MLGLLDNGGAEFGDRGAYRLSAAQQNEFKIAETRQVLA